MLSAVASCGLSNLFLPVVGEIVGGGFGKLQSALQMPWLSSEHGGKSSGVRLPGGRVHRGAFRRRRGGYHRFKLNEKAAVPFVCTHVTYRLRRTDEGCDVGQASANISYAMCFVL